MTKNYHNSAIHPLRICPKEIQTEPWSDICTPVFIIALFRIAKIRKQPKCSSTNEWTKKL